MQSRNRRLVDGLSAQGIRRLKFFNLYTVQKSYTKNMGEFKTSFTSIISRDLKHIYSGFPQTMKYRHAAPYPTQDQIRMQEENKDLKKYVLKSSEFVSEYGCLIPRAPAFRILSRHDVDRVVTRLRQPTVASKGISHTSDTMMREQKEREHAKYLGLKSVGEREMTMIVDRLTQPTKSSRIREIQTRSAGRMPDIHV